MTALVNRLFRLRPGEARLVLAMGFLLLANSVALEVSDVISVSGFLSQVETPAILIVWIVDFTLIILATGLQSLIIDRFQRLAFIRWMIFGLALAYIILRLLFTFGIPSWLNYSILFLLSDQQWLFFPLIFWVLANDIFSDLTQAKRLFPVIASFGFVGQIIGLGISAAAPKVLAGLGTSSLELLSLIVFIYLISYIVVSAGLGKVTVRQTNRKVETIKETLTEGWGFVKEVPAFRYLMLGVMLAAAVIIMIEFRFLRVSDENLVEPGSFQTFYSLTRLAVTVVAFIIQSFLTSRLIDKIGLKNSLFIMPVVLGLAIAAMIIEPGIFVATAGIMAMRLSKQTVDESAKKSLQALVPEERRGRVSIFMDSYLFSLGIILGCIIAGIGILVNNAMGIEGDAYIFYLAVGLAFILATIWALVLMRRNYDASMLNWRLKRRQRSSGVLEKLEF